MLATKLDFSPVVTVMKFIKIISDFYWSIIFENANDRSGGEVAIAPVIKPSDCHHLAV
jgi:hypothetical protein